MQEIINRVRESYEREEKLNDDIAMDIIVKTIFEFPNIIDKSVEEQDIIIKKIFYKTRRKMGIIQPLIEDDEISEIMVNGPENIFYEKHGIIKKYDMTFDSTDELEEVMRNIASDVHREINEMNPIVDARLKDGSRVNGVYKNIAINGPALTIRKFLDKYMNMSDLVKNETITEDGAVLLKTLVECGYNIFVSGGTSSGKTTLLNALAEAVPKEERVIVIEDSMELKLGYITNIVHMECRNANSQGKGSVSMADLIKSSLRMRPNRIIVGEVRGKEVIDMLQAMNSGHSGSMSTGHGNSVKGMLRRLESMYLMGVNLNIDAIRDQIAEAIDIMVHIERMDNGLRKVTEIDELLDYQNGQFVLNPLMKLDLTTKLCSTNNKIINSRRITLKGENKIEELRNHGFDIQGDINICNFDNNNWDDNREYFL